MTGPFLAIAFAIENVRSIIDTRGIGAQAIGLLGTAAAVTLLLIAQ